MSHASRSTLKIFAWPALIATGVAVGLFAALLGDGGFDALSWLGLGIPAWLGLRGFRRR